MEAANKEDAEEVFLKAEDDFRKGSKEVGS